MKKLILSATFAVLSTIAVVAQQPADRNNDNDQRRAEMRAKWDAMTPAERQNAKAKMDSTRRTRGGGDWRRGGERNGDNGSGSGNGSGNGRGNGRGSQQQDANMPQKVDSTVNNTLNKANGDVIKKNGGFNKKRKDTGNN